MDGNFVRKEDKIFSPHMSYEQFGKRFSGYFDQVRLVARSFSSTNAVGGVVTGERLAFVDLGSNRGAKSLFQSLPRILWRLYGEIAASGIVLIRFPGNIAMLAMLVCFLTRRKFSVEIVADAADYFSKEASNHPLRFVARLLHTWSTRVAARQGVTARYVTAEYLQSRYPGRCPDRMFGFSDAYLPEELFSVGATRAYTHTNAIEIINVGMMHNHSKGHLILLRCCADLRDRGIDFRLTLVGGGRVEAEIIAEARRLALCDVVVFRGVLPASEVRELLAKSDLFVLPSLQEGLSRAMLEAMAVGTPVIATNVGGISEVVPHESIVTPGDVTALSTRVASFSQNQSREKDLARSQCKKAMQYAFSSLQIHYHAYFSALSDSHASS
ncbi:glycosyl transferase group 1 [Burkholderia sp. H160]|nr:glycosyl transferase group 1 [Burkholderia sp. H160]